jgi:hypothetical protein
MTEASKDSSGFKLSVRDTSVKRDTTILLPKSSISLQQNISRGDSLHAKPPSLLKSANVEDSAGFKLGVRDISARSDSLILLLKSVDSRPQKMS